MFFLSLLFLTYTSKLYEPSCHDIWKASHRSNNQYESASQITPHIWIGSVCAAHNYSWLIENDIFLSISVASEWSYSIHYASYHRHIPINNIIDDDDIDSLLKIGKLIHENEDDGSILVYCTTGTARSSAAVVWYLLGYLMHDRSYDDVETFVRSKRPIITPNPTLRSIVTKKLELK